MASRAWVQLALVATMVLWGVSFVASKVVLQQVSAPTYMAVRFGLATVVMVGVLWWHGVPRLGWRTHVLIALTALAEPVAYFLFEAYGLQRTTATLASLIIATVPLAVMVVARVLLGEAIPPKGVAAVLISLAGIGLLVIGGGGEQGSTSVVGVLLVFGAVISAAFYITLARKLMQTQSPVVLTGFQTIYGALAFAVFWVLQPAEARMAVMDVAGWTALLFLVFGATVLAFLFYNFALRHERAGTAALYINGIPVVTALTGWLLLGERLTWLQLLGAAAVLVAVRLATMAGAAEAPPVELA